MRWLIMLVSSALLMTCIFWGGGGSSEYQVEVRHTRDGAEPLSIQQVLARDWSQDDFSRVNYGASGEGHWFHFDIPDSYFESDENVIVEVHYPTVDYLAFYVADSKGRIGQHYVTGTDFPFSSRPIWDDDFVFKVRPDIDGKRVFLYAKTSNSLQMPIRLYSETEFYEKEEWTLILWGAYYGTLLVMALHSLLNGIIIRERLFYYYVVYVLSTALMVSSLNGHGFAYLWPNNPSFNNASVTLFTSLMTIFGVAFAMALLNIERYHRMYRRLGKGTMWIAALLALFAVLTLRDFGWFASWVALLFAGVMMLFGIKSVLERYYLGWYFLAGWSVLLLSIGIFALNMLGLLPSAAWVYHSKEIGSIFEIVIFSMAMSAIYRHEQEERSRVNSALGLMKQQLQNRVNIVNSKSGFLEIPKLESHVNDIRDLDRRVHGDMGRVLVVSVLVMDRITQRPDYIALGDCLRSLFNSRITVFPFKTSTPGLPGEVTVLVFPLHNKFEAEGVIERVEKWNYALGDQYDLHFGYAISHLTEKYDVDYIEESFHYLEEAVQKKAISYSIDDTLSFIHRQQSPT